MSYHMTQLSLSVCAVIVFAFAGCGDNSSQPAAPESDHDHEDVHASTGPHGGSLIELGEEEYHAELVHDEAAGTVTVYLLDSAAKAAVPIDATEVVINLKHEGRGEQFKLAAEADVNDPQGKASRFVSSDSELAEDLDREDAGAQLAVAINGKPYQGAIEHEHEHE